MYKQIHNTSYYIDRYSNIVNRKFNVDRKMSPYIAGNGYLTVRLSNNGKVVNYSVHRLLAEAFIPNPENKPCVNHKDGNKLNNSLDNLEWVTYAENTKHATRIGINKVPIRPKTRIACYSSGGDLLFKFDSISQAAAYTGVSRKTIMRVANGSNKCNTKYKFKECNTHV